MTWNVHDAVDVYRKTHVEGERLTTSDLELDEVNDVHEAIRCWDAADDLMRAAKIVKAVAAVRVGQLLGKDGAARTGDRIVRYRHVRKERCFDPAGAIGYLTEQVKNGEVDLGDVMNPQYIKRAWMDDAIRDTFYEWEEADEPTVASVTVDRAPKWLQKLGDGEVI